MINKIDEKIKEVISIMDYDWEREVFLFTFIDGIIIEVVGELVHREIAIRKAISWWLVDKKAKEKRSEKVH